MTFQENFYDPVNVDSAIKTALGAFFTSSLTFILDSAVARRRDRPVSPGMTIQKKKAE